MKSERSKRRLVSAGALLAALLALAAPGAARSRAAATAASQTGAATLTPGRVIEGELRAGERHDHPLPLAGNRFVRLEVEQVEGDVTVRLVDPGGQVVRQADLPGKPWLIERISAIVEKDGPHRVRVERAPGQGPVRYRLELLEERQAVSGDLTRVAADDALREGMRLQEMPEIDARQRALERFRRAAELFAASADLAGEGEALLQIGDSHASLSDYPQALEAYRGALAASESLGDKRGAATALSRIGGSMLDFGQREEVAEIYRRALELSHEAGARDLEASVLLGQGVLAFYQGDLGGAERNLRRAVALRRELGDRKGTASALNTLGAILRNAGRTRDALDAYEEALTLVREIEDVPTELPLLNNVGVLATYRGELNDALGTYSRALRLARQSGDRQREALIASNLGTLYRLLGEPRRALELHRRALELDRGIESVAGEVRDLMELGRTYEALGEPRKAIDYYAEALPKSGATQDSKARGLILHGMGRSRLALGEPATALQLFEQALALQEQSANRVGQLTTLLDRGISQRRLGDLTAAAASLERSLELARQVRVPRLEAAAQSEIARLERQRGDLDAALAAASAALDTLESLRVHVPGPDLRSAFFSKSQEDFALFIGLRLELDASRPAEGHRAAAFEASERARARTLVELLTEARIEVREGIDAALLEREKELTASLSDLQSKLVRELSREEPRPDRAQALRDEIEALRERRREFELELRRRHPRYAEIRYPEPLKLDRVQEMLEADTALLQYFLGEQRSYLFAVARDGFSVHSLPGESEIAALVRSGREALQQPGRRLWGQYAEVARSLYDTIIAPAGELLERKQRLLIAPAGDLHLFPFEALLRPASPAAGGRPHYLVERWSVAYVPSASVLAGLESPAGAATDGSGGVTFVGFADPDMPGIALRQAGSPLPQPALRGALDRESWRWRKLPGARREVTSISRLFAPEESLLFVGAEAREAHVKNNQALRSARIVHFASHALVDGEQPAYSALLMSEDRSGARTEDGLLQVHEIFNLRLAADLVVLSACETALGRRVRGEGLVGLTQAFLYAGARSVSVSLWPVADESTADLMLGFYRRINQGASKAEALRQAKLELIRSEAQHHPYYWAPFVLIGSPG